MGSGWFGYADMGIVGVAVIALAVWQLISINRDLGKDRKPPDDPAT